MAPHSTPHFWPALWKWSWQPIEVRAIMLLHLKDVKVTIQCLCVTNNDECVKL